VRGSEMPPVKVESVVAEKAETKCNGEVRKAWWELIEAVIVPALIARIAAEQEDGSENVGYE
jgi:hypothetical protein